MLLSTDKGTLIIHLGMSGSLRILGHNTPAEKHDHVDIVFSNGSLLRFRDPRRFGAMLWTTGNAMQHKLLRDLGVEPLENDFTADYLHQISRNHKLAISWWVSGISMLMKRCFWPESALPLPQNE